MRQCNAMINAQSYPRPAPRVKFPVTPRQFHERYLWHDPGELVSDVVGVVLLLCCLFFFKSRFMTRVMTGCL